MNAYNTSAVLQSSPRLPRPSKRLAAGLAVILSLCAAGSVSARPAMPLLAAAEVPAHVGPAYAFVNREPAEFGEIWAYLMAGEERFLVADAPITDLAYFSARISSKGELYGAPDIQKLSAVKARKHLVVAEVSNQALIHFVLNPAYPLRNKLIKDIAAAAKPYDGVNIDFESMRTDDGPAFLEFLKLLKKELGKKTLSVCVPARTRAMNDAYDYAKLAAIVDRVFVMSYDEHWSGSAAGPVSSIAWASRVASWAVSAVGSAKLIMGMPFYGRAWGDQSPAGAYKYSGAAQIMARHEALSSRNAEGIPYFRFTETVNLILYYDDALSTRLRADSYLRTGVDKIGFWRLGQEAPDIWRELKARP